MRVLHITSAYPYSDHGVYGIFVKEQVESLEALGICNEVCFINARQQGSVQYFKSLPQIRRLSQNCDIVHCHHPYSGMAYLLATGGNRPMVYSHLGDIEKPPSLINGLFQKISCARASAVIFKSNPKARRYPDHYYYLPNGVNTELFRPMNKNEAKRQLGLDMDKKYILFVSAVGTANPVKRYDKYRDAMALLKSSVANVEELVMAGVQRARTPLYFNACEALLLTSDQEGSPNVVKEALACGVPVVSTDVGNVKIMLAGCNASYVAETGEAAELTRLLERSLQKEFKNERASIFDAQLDMGSVARKLEEIYKGILIKSDYLNEGVKR